MPIATVAFGKFLGYFSIESPRAPQRLGDIASTEYRNGIFSIQGVPKIWCVLSVVCFPIFRMVDQQLLNSRVVVAKSIANRPEGVD